MVMGGPAVGKTTSIRRLRDDGQQMENIPLSTDGVELEDVVLKDGTILETWDFGGQKIYRISHQLFLRDFCIYTVVCRVNDAPEDALRELHFWIESVLSRTERVRILLITTNGDRLKPNEAEAAHKHLHRSLIARYGEEKIYSQAVMLRWVKKSFFNRKVKDEGAEALRDVLLKVSDEVAFDAPASLEVIRVALETLKQGPIVKISLVHQVIQSEGNKKGIKALEDEERCMEFLEDLDTLGYIYLVRPRRMLTLSSSKEGPASTEMAVVLNPQWISRLLATLITTKHSFAQSSGGVIDHDTLTLHLWRKEEDFHERYHEDMINLLVQLHIMFPLRSPNQKQRKYFVPCLLKENEPQHNHGIESEFRFRIGGQHRVVLDRTFKMKNQASVPVAVMPMVIVQLMKIGEVIECWQQGCAVAIYPADGLSKAVECYCLVKRKRGDKLNIKLEGASSEVAGWWMKEVMRSLENMLEEFYHMDYDVEVAYYGEGRGMSCFPRQYKFSYLYKIVAQRKVTALCQNECHNVAVQYLVPDLLIQEASTLSLVSWEDLEIEKELGQGSFGKVLLCSSSINFQKLSSGERKLSSSSTPSLASPPSISSPSPPLSFPEPELPSSISPPIPSLLSVPSLCKYCERREVKFFCDQCEEDESFLCQNCRRTLHLGKRKRNHTPVPILEYLTENATESISPSPSPSSSSPSHLSPPSPSLSSVIERDHFAYAAKVLEPKHVKLAQDSCQIGSDEKKPPTEEGLQKDFLLEVYTMTGLSLSLLFIPHPLWWFL